MAPSTIEEVSSPVDQNHHDLKSKSAASRIEVEHGRKPLQLKGVLDQFKQFDVTPIIGREFVDANLAEWLRAPNSDDLIRDLAITSKCSLYFSTKLFCASVFGFLNPDVMSRAATLQEQLASK